MSAGFGQAESVREAMFEDLQFLLLKFQLDAELLQSVLELLVALAMASITIPRSQAVLVISIPRTQAVFFIFGNWSRFVTFGSSERYLMTYAHLVYRNIPVTFEQQPVHRVADLGRRSGNDGSP
jgi:hypothetical protein